MGEQVHPLGEIVAELPNAQFRVRLDDGREVVAKPVKSLMRSPFVCALQKRVEVAFRNPPKIARIVRVVR